MRRFTAVALLAALILTGCSDDGDDDATDSTATEADDAGSETTAADDDASAEDDSEADTNGPADADADATDDEADAEVPAVGDDFAPGEGECPYLTADALGEAFDATFTVASGSDTGCGFQSDDGLTVVLSRIDIAIDPDDYIEGAADTCDPPTTQMVDAGDAAFACIAVGPTATVFEGDVAINLGVVAAEDEDAVVDGFAAVLPSVTFP